MLKLAISRIEIPRSIHRVSVNHYDDKILIQGRLFQNSKITSVLCTATSLLDSLLEQINQKNSHIAVDYRLSGESCHPAQLLDALAGYSHLVQTLGIDPARIVLFGACAGG